MLLSNSLFVFATKTLHTISSYITCQELCLSTKLIKEEVFKRQKGIPFFITNLINQYIRSPMQQILWLKKIVILLHTIGAYPPHNMCGAFAHNVLSIKM